MPHFIIAYLGGDKPESPEAGAQQMERWKAWLQELGTAVVNPGTPLGPSKIVSANGVADHQAPDRLTGFTVVEADTLEAALDMAQSCPFLEMGSLQVAQMMEMQ